MSKNDEKIQRLLLTIEEKKKSMGVRPRGLWETNGIVNGHNLNTIASIDKCVEITMELLLKKEAFEKAYKYLDVEGENSSFDDALKDLSLRVKMLKWDLENKKLASMEKQLKDMRSEDAKTEDALSDIAKEIGICSKE
jgi:hypothetical protein